MSAPCESTTDDVETTTVAPVETPAPSTTHPPTPAVQPPSTCYTHQLTSQRFTWEGARDYCEREGGQLAFHGFQSIEYRETVICGTFGIYHLSSICDFYQRLWWGIEKLAGRWQYVDGTEATDDVIRWRTSEIRVQGCGAMVVGYSSSGHLKVIDYPCSYEEYALCEFEC